MGGDGDDYLDANFAGFLGAPGRGPDGVPDIVDGGNDSDVAVFSSIDGDVAVNCETLNDVK